MIKCNLAVLMAERKMSIQDVADKTGLSRTTISALVNEIGKGIQFETMDTLCELFNITPGDLFSHFHMEASFSFNIREILEKGFNPSAIFTAVSSRKDFMSASLLVKDKENIKSELGLKVEVNTRIESEMYIFNGTLNMNLELQLNNDNEICGFSYVANSEEFSKFHKELPYFQSGFIINSLFTETVKFINEIPELSGLDSRMKSLPQLKQKFNNN